ncbi:hypothetical protein TWF696_006799 [Orbilia brochopaga]|uniref:Uncharacterized protein n=1 Tax=Orbilia brochopaga TaxID=3140254 RepID=A0AAV9UQC6_9PEZI
MSEPSYDKSYYSYQKPASRATHSLIQGESESENTKPDEPTTESVPVPTDDDGQPIYQFHNPGPNAGPEAEWDTAQYHLDSHPTEHGRSTFNYQQYHEEYKKQAAEDDKEDAANEPEEAPAGRRGSITSQPFKPPQRTQSFNIRDMRGDAQNAMIDDGDDSAHNYTQA